MKLVIKKNIPIPDARGGKGAKDATIAQLRAMKPGDSFIWPGKSISNIHVYGKLAGVKIVTWEVEKGKRRVWVIGPRED